MFLGAGDLHTCTAGVLDSKDGDLILTAAHCVAEGIDTTFVAGFHDAADPADDLAGRRGVPRSSMGDRTRIRWRTSQFCGWRATAAARSKRRPAVG